MAPETTYECHCVHTWSQVHEINPSLTITVIVGTGTALVLLQGMRHGGGVLPDHCGDATGHSEL